MLTVKGEGDSDCGIIFIGDTDPSSEFKQQNEPPPTKFIDVAGIKRRKRLRASRKRSFLCVAEERALASESISGASASTPSPVSKPVLSGPIKTRQVKAPTRLPDPEPCTSFEIDMEAATRRRPDVQFGVDLVASADRLTNESIQNIMAKNTFPTFDVMSMIREISRVPNKNSPLYRALCANVALAASHNAMAAALTTLNETVKQIRATQASTDDKARAEAVTGFGSFPCPEQEFRLKGTEYGKGVSLNKVYRELATKFQGKLKCEADYFSFFTAFLEMVCMRAYDKPNWPFLTVRVKKRKNEKIEMDHETIIAFMKATHEAGGQPVDYRFEDNTQKLFITVLNNFRRRVKRVVLEEGVNMDELSMGSSSDEECSDMVEIKTESTD
ncbi:hypothetical protein ANCCAN_17682 [Ancylostoma caninum]|uniref:Uncharacterized protein n=1 Tax=Ancylostoma caninum TaxID=29170 RepID=A0A368FW58_ANCCA|nr:hypothetical protein ANCCAN_17682 [Ancylostoma caninum]